MKRTLELSRAARGADRGAPSFPTPSSASLTLVPCTERDFKDTIQNKSCLHPPSTRVLWSTNIGFRYPPKPSMVRGKHPLLQKLHLDLYTALLCHKFLLVVHTIPTWQTIMLQFAVLLFLFLGLWITIASNKYMAEVCGSKVPPQDLSKNIIWQLSIVKKLQPYLLLDLLSSITNLPCRLSHQWLLCLLSSGTISSHPWARWSGCLTINCSPHLPPLTHTLPTKRPGNPHF